MSVTGSDQGWDDGDPRRDDRSDDRHTPADGTRPPGPVGEPYADPDPDAATTDRTPTPLTQQLGRITLVVLAVLFVVFAAANSQPVDFSWIVGTTEVTTDAAGQASGGVPLILLLGVALAIGVVIGALLEWQFLRARRHRRRG
jgi:uncharacterized integral membrane protein